MKSVFILEHLHTLTSGEESWKRIGIYRTWDDALAAIDRVKSQPGFSDFPLLIDRMDGKDGFHIDKYPLNEDNWQEGYVTV